MKSSRFLIAALALAAAACEPQQPIKTSSGDNVIGLSFEERFALSSDAKETTLHGDRLRKAIELMDRGGVMALSGEYAAAGVVDTSTLVIMITSVGNRERKLAIRNCAEPTVCKFFATAVQSGVVDRAPLVCRGQVACSGR